MLNNNTRFNKFSNIHNLIIEGKLDPTQTDIDRLFGQVIEYLSFGKLVFIAIYGFIPQSYVDRINQQIVSKYDGVSLFYVSNPNRTRKAQEVMALND